MKLDPYYKAVDEHSIDCKLVKEYESKAINARTKDGKQNPRGKKDSSLSDIFEFSRPKSHTEKLETSTSNNLPASLEERKKKNATNQVIQLTALQDTIPFEHLFQNT